MADQNSKEEFESTLTRLKLGGAKAVAEIFLEFRPPLARMIDFRLDQRLYGRIDTNDVLQEAFLTVSERYTEYVANPKVTFFVWLRQMTFQTLLLVHRRHFGVKKRDVTQEVSLNWSDQSAATSTCLAAQIAGEITSPSSAAIRDERSNQLKAALNKMDEIDREVLALRHFEHLSNKEVSEVLGLSKTAASNRYIRAMERLKLIVDEVMAEQG